ncbi:normocyte-binding protein [Paenibacillus woosongensis]|uniref:Normocyte-binding protein n=1 Tax=Paenibacillus woosongensis TaxID=307580 RepID=A0A7X2YYU4_9BACL|nr:normocyte-binding protein [Paenibacillus woosongensis]MUG44345.1 normocyte-binding protein [Paenibacillus woosongensis]
MKDIVMDRLSKMEDLQQRGMLRNLMSSVFLGVVEYQEELNRQIERRVFEEVGNQDSKYDIYAAMCRREEWDPLHEYLFPMIPEDTGPRSIDLQSLVARLKEGEELPLFSFFLECPYPVIQELLYSDRTFRGELVTSGGRHAIQIRLERNMTYIREIEKLYHVFLSNGLPWRTINHPYAYKFVNAVLVGGELQLGEEEEVQEITVHLEEYEEYKRTDLVPLWNIQRLELKTGGFPVPAADRVNFEHALPLRSSGLQHGYLVDINDDSIRYIKRSPEELTVVSTRDKSDAWQVLKVVEPVGTSMSKLSYALMSNRQRDDFISNYGRRQGQVVRSKGEIVRIIHSFAVSEWLELVDVEIRPPSARPALTYELNRFITDEVRVDNGKWRMCLKFNYRETGRELGYLAEDMMSFLVSEVQMSFPEYRCEGEWA